MKGAGFSRAAYERAVRRVLADATAELQGRPGAAALLDWMEGTEAA